jgi:hypothetical protein
MKTSITIATFLVAGATVAGVAAAPQLPSPWFGSDTLFSITGAVITATFGSGDVPDYVGGGSGGGASAMAKGATAAAAAQQTAPMSRMIKNEGAVCTTFNGQTVPGAADTSASGVVIGLDGVDIFSSTSAGGATGGTTCNGPSTAQSNDNAGFGLAFSGTANVFGTTAVGQTAAANPAQTWKWALALVYGGNDLSVTGGGPNGIPDCNQPARQNLVANWSTLFQNCSNASAACAASGPTGGALWHAFRRDDTSGTSDVFSTILGISPSTSSSSNNGFGASPYCNALNWDTATSGTTAPGTCSAKPHDNFTGPGGIPNTLATDATSKPGNHRRPPPGVWGDAPLPSQNKTTDADVLPVQQQDNDPIRRKCLGNGVTNNVGVAGEEVCNIDGALGLVLPMVDTDFMLTLKVPGPLQQYPTNASNAFAPSGGRPVNVFSCAPAAATKHSGECPNGDALNLSVCAVPVDNVHNTSQVISAKSTVGPSILATRPACAGHYGATQAASLAANALDVFVPGATTDAASGCLANAGGPDGRHFNVQMHDGNSGLAGQNNPGYAGELIPALGTSVDMAAGYNRIHQVETVLGGSGGVGAAAGCQLVDMTDQIGCLAQADPCSIGYAGDAAKAIVTAGIANPGAGNTGTPGAATQAWTGTTGPLGGFDSVRAAQVYPSAATVQLLGQAGEYQIARKLYFNSLVGFANVAATTADPTAANELTIAKFESTPSSMNTIVTAQQEFTLGQQFVGGAPDPQFCEDFNEQMVCNDVGGAPANVNGCATNPSGIPAGAPGAAGSNPGTPGASEAAGTSTICGDGIRQAYEECDNGTVASPANGHTTGNNNADHTAGGCSTTCRCVNDFVNGNCN